MGQAKQRGTFEERKAQAIERDATIKDIMDNYDREHPIKSDGMSVNEKLFHAYTLAKIAETKNRRYFR